MFYLCAPVSTGSLEKKSSSLKYWDNKKKDKEDQVRFNFPWVKRLKILYNEEFDPG